MDKNNRRKGTLIMIDMRTIAALTTAAMVALCAALALAGKASAEVVRGEGWLAVGATLAPSSHVRLSCPQGWQGTGFDVAGERPFAPARGQWIDGGEAMAFYLRYRIALARPSQTYGLSAVAFKSYARAVAVEVICER